MARIPGVPTTVSPEVYENLKAHHPNFSMYKEAIDQRLASYNETQPKLTPKQQEKAALVSEGGGEALSTLKPVEHPRTAEQMVEELQEVEKAQAAIKVASGLSPDAQVLSTPPAPVTEEAIEAAPAEGKAASKKK